MRKAARALSITAVAVLVFAAAALAQKPVSLGGEITKTFTVDAIDHASRIVTLKGEDGMLDDVYCGPEVQRFDSLKVGDKVSFRYHESLVTAIRHSTAAAKPAESAAVTRTAGDKPGGTIARQMTAVVTIDNIDPKVPSVTVKTADGRRMSFKVEDPKNLAGYKAGDNVEVTYTQALAVSVTPSK